MNKNLFIRSRLNPILKPDPKHDWESLKLYNPGVIYCGGRYHLFYRSVNGGKHWKSAIGYAVSDDGENFQRYDGPLLLGDEEGEKRGLEDPRITKIGDIFYMVYGAYDGITPRLSIAISRDLKKWNKYGPAFCDWSFEKAGGVYIEFNEKGEPFIRSRDVEWSKSGGIFPEKINGGFLMLFGEQRIWFAASDNGIKWTGDQKPFLTPRKGDYFDNVFVEMGPPPIKTKKGWLVLYHGVNRKNCYQIGVLLLDAKNPRKILYRSDKPVFSPRESYETYGIVDVLPIGLKEEEKMTKKN
ncbi:hypothetical protein A2331_00975 [Candidatus Falkowbacteria bacterium RIFOXYB2_FULL_34_18]|uniref:Glycosidase n=1 Tax=Candidatus Falkowbacteria bacterium RIFOXYD2_FULL_34_120 TaxID=1798007 RepID=A0A1F5TSH5_9BACT|nr:MAG: hypothetical protein A2331_00975 [Candidatus Falkowbacteria bacterium RIFOXYB2_FULL_34_18]OGF30181.1 MAG: hypothetical protein A2500_02135 [Candidatus Falkowbacteria bacterium RIFOXYC12_FULL_34_55]OGF37670.1 MAG: hypothetical protein A2466_05530 [Candidatus Falkowbacteria bacterium RIFOXYC2_FULL_34_220]OGF39397.1 MAG: hypothetical protein A2515_02760 [Candidatus Falkowbacteria bacterium RIFOXYD12_FULL_34_57]OGF41926.1 MAG: hypothetical protein A2531_04825 [Candidatus Falkowbacteria bact